MRWKICSLNTFRIKYYPDVPQAPEIHKNNWCRITVFFLLLREFVNFLYIFAWTESLCYQGCCLTDLKFKLSKLLLLRIWSNYVWLLWLWNFWSSPSASVFQMRAMFSLPSSGDLTPHWISTAHFDCQQFYLSVLPHLLSPPPPPLVVSNFDMGEVWRFLENQVQDVSIDLSHSVMLMLCIYQLLSFLVLVSRSLALIFMCCWINYVKNNYLKENWSFCSFKWLKFAVSLTVFHLVSFTYR